MYKIYKQNDFDFTLIDGSPFVVISDIDETYLRTDFKTLKGLFTTALQFAVDKITYPDMTLYYKTIKKIPNTALYFISSSPVQMAGVLQKKFLLEELPFDGLILRDAVDLFLSGHGDEIRNPFGYKLFAILNLMDDFPRETTIVFIGDDTESDRDIYETVKAIVDREMHSRDLITLLENMDVQSEQIPQITLYAKSAGEKSFQVASIYIRRTGGDPFDDGREAGNGDVLYFTHPHTMMADLAEKNIVSPELFEKFSKSAAEKSSG